MIEKPSPEVLKKAVEILRSGGCVAFATETVYGLGADISSEDGLRAIFELKGRPQTDPLIVHVAAAAELSLIVEEVPEVAKILIERFWPGPLTLILKKKPTVSPLITAGLETVAVRSPKHPVAQQLLKALGGPIAAPSANRFQSISPTTAEAVEKELGSSLLILDGGASHDGLESTVISLVGKPCVLRLGAVTLEQLSEVFDEPPHLSTAAERAEHLPQVSPGQLDFHYAPKTSLRFVSNFEALEQQGAVDKITTYLLVFSNREREMALKKGYHRIKVLSVAGDLGEAAHNLYSALRELDEMRPRLIVAMKVPDRGLGKAINDRLNKASHTS